MIVIYHYRSDSTNISGTKNPTEALIVAMNGTITAMSNVNPLLVQQAICKMINTIVRPFGTVHEAY